MKKRSVFKKIILINLIFLFSTKLNCCVNYDYDNYEYDYKLVSQFDLQKNVKKACSNYIKKSGYNHKSRNFPNKLLAEYKLKVDQTLQELKNDLKLNWKVNVSYYKIRETAEKNLKKFKHTLSKITLSNNLETKIDELIKKLVSIYSISDSEYFSKKRKILKNLRRTIKEDGRNYIRKNEIKKQIKEKFENYLNENESYWTDYFNPFFNTPSHTNESHINETSFDFSFNSSSKTEKIKSHQLDNKITEVATKLLGIKPEKIPARVISDYSDKIKKIKTQLNNSISYYKDYVTLKDINRVCKEELQSIMDKINYKNERCAICQDKYKPKDKVGTLSCNGGHIFHKDCIYQWLKADNKKSCPLCRQQNVIVAKIEDVSYKKIL